MSAYSLSLMLFQKVVGHNFYVPSSLIPGPIAPLPLGLDEMPFVPMTQPEAPPSTTTEATTDSTTERFHVALPNSETGRFRDSAFILSASMHLWMENTDWSAGEAPFNMVINFTQGNQTPVLRRIRRHQQSLRAKFVRNKKRLRRNPTWPNLLRHHLPQRIGQRNGMLIAQSKIIEMGCWSVVVVTLSVCPSSRLSMHLPVSLYIMGFVCFYQKLAVRS